MKNISKLLFTLSLGFLTGPDILFTRIASAAPLSSGLGLQVNTAGVLTKAGTPYRGVGVNYYDAFLRALRNPADDSYREGFAKLGEHKIPFARFSAGGYWAVDYQTYFRDKAEYFRLMDGVVRAAEDAHVGLIPSLFWSITAVSDAVGEPRDQWGNPNSKTRKFMRNYTREFVTRYRSSPAIWGWEFSCEVPLALDLPDPQNHRPPVAPQYGTPKIRSSRDALSYADFKSAALDFAATVREIDPDRMLLTGNALPRPTAYHHSIHQGNVHDTEAEFSQMLLRDNPGPFSPVCVHGGAQDASGYFADRRVDYKELLQVCVATSLTAKKPLYVEEFVAVPAQLARRSPAEQRDYFSNELDSIVASGASLASVWVYDRKLAAGPSLSYDNQWADMLDQISQRNLALLSRQPSE